jgi:hypothetical protein
MSEYYAGYNTLIQKDTSSDNVLASAFENLGAVTTHAGDDFLIYNGTTVDILINITAGSTTATTAEIVVPAGATYAGNCFQKNKRLLPGTQFQVKSVTGTISTGIIYVIVEHKR